MAEQYQPPSKEEIAELELFQGLTLEQIVLPETEQELAAAVADLESCSFIGFDTESRPTFRKGQESNGPHVVQFSTLKTGYIFQLHNTQNHDAICRILKSAEVVKVGFGLKSDRSHLLRKFGVTAHSLFDLDQAYRKLGYRKQLGVKAAIAVQFNQRFQKSKKQSTSNWALKQLAPAQLLYAANDAYSALKILDALLQEGHVKLIEDLLDN